MVCVCILYRKHPLAQPTVVLENPGIEPARGISTTTTVASQISTPQCLLVVSVVVFFLINSTVISRISAFSSLEGLGV